LSLVIIITVKKNHGLRLGFIGVSTPLSIIFQLVFFFKMKDIEVPGEKPVTLSQKAVSSTIIPQKLLLPHWMELNHRFTTFLLQTY
jgi:hypothetical protein